MHRGVISGQHSRGDKCFSTGQSAVEVLRLVMEEGIRFVDGGAFSNDLAVLVARRNNEARETEEEAR